MRRRNNRLLAKFKCNFFCFYVKRIFAVEERSNTSRKADCICHLEIPTLSPRKLSARDILGRMNAKRRRPVLHPSHNTTRSAYEQRASPGNKEVEIQRNINKLTSHKNYCKNSKVAHCNLRIVGLGVEIIER